MNPSAVTIRAPEETERPAILAVLNEAFGQEDEAHLVDRLWMANAIIHEFIAEADGVIIGYCAFSEVTAAPAMEGRLLGLAPVAVTSERQNCGAGKALIEYGLNACRIGGAALVVVLGEAAYYSRFGFEPASRFNITWGAKDAGDAFQLIEFADITGGKPRKIDYHAAFEKV